MRIIETLDDYRSMIATVESATILYLDTETTGLDPYTARLLLLSLRANKQTYVINFTKIPVRHLHDLRRTLTTKLCVWHNVTYDWKIIFHNSGIEMRQLYCTMVGEQLLIAGLKGVSASLQAVTERRLKIYLDKQVREGFIDKQDDLITNEAYEYAAKDVDVLEEIYRQQTEEIAGQDLQRVCELEMALLPVTARMEYTGISIDQARLEASIPVFRTLVQRTDRALQDIVIQNGLADTIVFTRDNYTAVNTASPPQMLQIAHAFGIDVKSLNKKELTDWDNKWAAKRNRQIDFIIENEDDDEDIKIAYHHPFLRRHAIRTASEKIYGTYVLGIFQRINPITKRIHTSFRQCGAASTGRYSSIQPNLQNLPQAGKLKALGMQEHDIRSMFIPSPGRKLIICDFSGIEAVILAAWAQDGYMLEQLAHGDIHCYVATQLFGVEVSKERASQKLEPDVTLRTSAKTLTYAIMYGTTGWNLYRTLSAALASVGIRMTQGDGDRYIKVWHSLFPKAAHVLQSNAAKAVTQFYVTTALGRRRRWEPLYLRNEHGGIKEGAWHAAEREGANAPIQGGSADMTKLALLKSDQQLDRYQSAILLCVHDEIVIEADDSYVETGQSILKHCMEEAGYELYPAARPYGLIKAEPKISICYDK